MVMLRGRTERLMEMTRITCCPQTGLPVLTMVSVVASVGRVLLLICIFRVLATMTGLVGCEATQGIPQYGGNTRPYYPVSGQVINAGVRRILMVFIPV